MFFLREIKESKNTINSNWENNLTWICLLLHQQDRVQKVVVLDMSHCFFSSIETKPIICYYRKFGPVDRLKDFHFSRHNMNIAILKEQSRPTKKRKKRRKSTMKLKGEMA
jgi:hypothetical protein